MLIVPQFAGPPERSSVTHVLGGPDQVLAQALWEGVTSQDVFHPLTVLADGDPPLTTVIVGRNDATEQCAWSPERVALLEELDGAGRGTRVDWDERGHSAWDVDGGTWVGTQRHSAEHLGEHRSDRSFPGFALDDQDSDATGRQPDLGNGEVDDGDVWGTWSGYHRWELQTDDDDAWEAWLWLDGTDTSSATLHIRRPGAFRPAAGELLVWSFGEQGGDVVVGEEGRVSIEDVVVTSERVLFRVAPEAEATLDSGEPRETGASGSGVARPEPKCSCGTTPASLVWLLAVIGPVARRRRR
jgi:MYXO-CTERM domain-containing protein